MRLRRVILTGFKTFARRSEVVFEPGMTGIVGPNGSGKSNLVDAIRWALGETKARELRGARMDEVIYAGGHTKARMGVAEVEMIFDNEDGKLAASDPEVSISRRVVRGGDIEYRINSERARLRDVERLLGGTGLTQSGYAVVAQNDIDAIIEATPRQRRALIEQAAGVRPIQIACEDAAKRLDAVDAVVARLSDRLAESEPRLAQLEIEAAAALEARQFTDKLAELRGSLAKEEWRAACARLRQAKRRLEAARTRLDAAASTEGEAQSAIDEARAAFDLARKRQRDAAARLETLRINLERAKSEMERWSDRARGAVLNRAQAVVRSEEAKVAIAAAASEAGSQLPLFEGGATEDESIQAAEMAVSEAQRELQATSARREQVAATVRDADERANAADLRLSEARSAVNALLKELDAASREARTALAAAAQLNGELAGVLGGNGAVAQAAEALGASRLADAIEVIDPADTRAIDAALEEHLGAWIVRDWEQAVGLLEGTGSREEIAASGEAFNAQVVAPRGTRSAWSAIRCRPEAQAAAVRWLGQTWLASDLETARRAVSEAGGQAVLPDGTVVSAFSLRGGPMPDTMALAADAKAAREEASRKQETTEAISLRLQSARESVEELETANRDAGGEVTKALAQLATADGAIVTAKANLELRRQQLERLEREASRRRTIAEQRRLDAERRLAEMQLAIAAGEMDAVTAMVRMSVARNLLGNSSGAVREATYDVEAASAPLAEMETGLLQLESVRSDARVVTARAEDEVAAADLETATAEAEVTELAVAVRDQTDDETDIDPDAARKVEREIVRLERALSAMGAVNALAPEQFEELNQRVKHVRAHRDDLRDAAAKIRGMIAYLTTEAETRFEAVFGAVTANFAELYAELFPGGHATLRMEQPEVTEGDGDPAETDAKAVIAGVEILAQPAGKRLQPLAHLSGGERALTSLAVILAMQQVNPSPFYIFDEVDAPLDDTNVLRLSRLLSRLSAKQQFIMVTHNHVSMAACQALYGVTIDNEGMSSVISVRFAAEEVPEGHVVGIGQSPLRAAAS